MLLLVYVSLRFSCTFFFSSFYFFSHCTQKLWFISGYSDGCLLLLKSLGSILFHFNCLCLVLYNCSKLVYGYTLTSLDFILQGCSSYPFTCSFSIYMYSS